LIQRHLQSMDYHTYKAISVKEAVSILKDTTIDLLITDLKMPEVDGFQLIRYAIEHYNSLPILVVTGYPSVNDALHIGKSGVMDYLVKPFTREELKNAVTKSLNSRKKERYTSTPVSHLNTSAYGELIGKSEAFEK